MWLVSVSLFEQGSGGINRHGSARASGLAPGQQRASAWCGPSSASRSNRSCTSRLQACTCARGGSGTARSAREFAWPTCKRIELRRRRPAGAPGQGKAAQQPASSSSWPKQKASSDTAQRQAATGAVQVKRVQRELILVGPVHS